MTNEIAPGPAFPRSEAGRKPNLMRKMISSLRRSRITGAAAKAKPIPYPKVEVNPTRQMLRAEFRRLAFIRATDSNPKMPRNERRKLSRAYACLAFTAALPEKNS